MRFRFIMNNFISVRISPKKTFGDIVSSVYYQTFHRNLINDHLIFRIITNFMMGPIFCNLNKSKIKQILKQISVFM
jgi:hypothetical protein